MVPAILGGETTPNLLQVKPYAALFHLVPIYQTHLTLQVAHWGHFLHLVGAALRQRVKLQSHLVRRLQ